MNYEKRLSVLKLSQVKFSNISICAFSHTRHIEYGCMFRKFKKVGNHQQQRIIYFMIWQNSLLPTILLIISNSNPTTPRIGTNLLGSNAGPPNPQELEIAMEKITQARRVYPTP